MALPFRKEAPSFVDHLLVIANRACHLVPPRAGRAGLTSRTIDRGEPRVSRGPGDSRQSQDADAACIVAVACTVLRIGRINLAIRRPSVIIASVGIAWDRNPSILL